MGGQRSQREEGGDRGVRRLAIGWKSGPNTRVCLAFVQPSALTASLLG